MCKRKDKRSEDEAAQKQQQPRKKPFGVGAAAAAAAADCANDVTKIELPNLVVSTELSTAGANAVVDSRRPPQHKSFARRITVNFLVRKSKINGGNSMPSRSSLDNNNNGCATNDQKPLVFGPSSSNTPSDMPTVAVTSPEYKAQSRLFGIALLGVGVKKNGATDSGGGDGNQRPQQKHRNSSSNTNDMDDDERSECHAQPVAPPSKEFISAPSAAVSTTTTEPGTKVGEKAGAITEEKPKERQKRPAKRTEDEEEKQEKKMPLEQRKEKPKRAPIKWKSDDEEEQKEKEESSVDQKKLAKAEGKAKEKAQKRADGGGESGGKTVRKARPQVQATASQAMNRRDAKGECHAPLVPSLPKECLSAPSEAVATTTESATKVGEKAATVAAAKMEEKPKKRQKRPAKLTEDEEEKQEKKISPEHQREQQPKRAPIKWFQTEDEEEEDKEKEKEGETSSEKSQNHEQPQQQPLQTLASPTREQQPQQQQQEQKPKLRAKRSATWRREAVPNMTVKRRSATLDEVMNATIPGVSSPSLGAGLPHAMPRRRPRILTTLDGSRTLAPFFTNAFAFSNHFKCQFTVDGLEFCCTEQFYMYYKARVFGDEASAVAILRSQDPKAIKRFGAHIRLFDTAKWRKVSILVMLIGNWKKYEQNPMLRQFLFETGDALLVEASPDDIYWGCGVHVDNTDLVRDMNKWRGRGAKNVLGRLLTRIRDTFKERDQFKHEWAEVQSKLPELYGISSGGGGGMPRRTI